MKIENGVYRLVGGNGGGFCVEVENGIIHPIDPGREVKGVIRIGDRTFTLNRWDESLTVNSDQTLQHGANRYAFTIEV